ncbi:PREDICTED: PR domain zinc finger protein 8 [Crocodylus porosus]|uniref:PR domain zinc finger protein 8 n=1 Tax=Crocodylus porosus TaxID=8502 RepID=UPI0009393D36|nr:PREDICTED: PR domain zinc finger protein 8 [Crocodylus porosus]
MEDAAVARGIWDGDAKTVQQCLTDIFTSVYTTCDIPENAIFGPCVLSHTSLYDSIAFIALKSTDKRTVPYIFRVDTSAANGSSEGLMWLRLVQSARDKEEQNLEAYIKNGQLFYRSLRRIAKDEELLVWYGKELTELLLLSTARHSKMNGRRRPRRLGRRGSSLWGAAGAGVSEVMCVCDSLGEEVTQPERRGEGSSGQISLTKCSLRSPQPSLFWNILDEHDYPFLYATAFWPKGSAAAAGPLQLQLPSALTLLPPSFTSLCLPAQNWCAKCNASFRMTSDLVYHMRSHHKKEYALEPLVKRRREEKLKCPICNESFRERHHLSRHMTSHN